MDNMKDNIGATIGLVFICILLLAPWYLWYQESNKRNELLNEYNSVKKEIQNMNKLVDTITDLIEENELLAKSENKYINLYCNSIKFSTPECKNFILETQKAAIKTEVKTQEYLDNELKKSGIKTTKNGTRYRLISDD